jgi:endonuclease-8
VLRGAEQEAVLWNGPVLALDDGPVRALGPDVLASEPDLDAVVARLRAAPDLPLGEALQDQRLVAGIGNMWMAETLWEIRVSPWLRVGEVADDVLRDAAAAARGLMLEAVSTGRPGRRVYRRAGRPCLRCGTIVRSRGQGDANRTAYWCPGCQAGAGPPGE